MAMEVATGNSRQFANGAKHGYKLNLESTIHNAVGKSIFLQGWLLPIARNVKVFDITTKVLGQACANSFPQRADVHQ